MQSKSTIQMRRLAWGAVAVLVILVLSAAPGHAFTVSVSDDTDINAKKPNQNNGTKENLIVRTGRGERHIFARFDLPTIPPGVTGADVDQATIQLFVSEVKKPGDISLHLVSGAWDEGTLTFNNTPEPEPPFATVSISAADENQYVSVDVTPEVQAWLDGAPNFGIAIGPSGGSNVRLKMDSKENTDTSHPMELEVALAGEGPQGPPGPQGAQGPQGNIGPQGDQGPPGAINLTQCGQINGDEVLLNSFFTTLSVSCPSGQVPISGGYSALQWNSANQCIPINNERNSNGWLVRFAAPTPTVCAAASARAFVFCCPSQ